VCHQVVEEEVVGLKSTSLSGSCGEASGVTSLLVLLPRGAEEKGLFSHPCVWFTTRLQPTLLQLQNYIYNLHRTCRNAPDQQRTIISGCATARARRAACWASESGSESRFHQPALTCGHCRSPNIIHAPSDSSSSRSHETYRPRSFPPLRVSSRCSPSRARRRNPMSRVWPTWAVCLA
jgi:hypothetical protein